MPYEVVRDEQACSPSNPWACRNSETDEVMGCHETRDAAMAQMRALMANEPAAGNRSLSFDEFVPELRSVTMQAELTGNKFVGYAATFDEVADIGEFTEETRRGSFRKVLSTQKEPIPFVYDHKMDRIPMAFTHAGTLRLAEDSRGLHVEADLPQKNPDADTLREQMERGEVRHMSYGFIAGRGNSTLEQRGGKPHRIITGYTALLDVSPTWCPFYRGTSAELRSDAFRRAIDLSQSAGGGADQQPAGEATQDRHDDPAVTDTQEDTQEEQRSGVDPTVMVEAAARRRRLQMMGLTLPKDIGPA